VVAFYYKMGSKYCLTKQATPFLLANAHESPKNSYEVALNLIPPNNH
jgi:hypothetical protein